MRTIRDWYRLSRSGTRGKFLDAIRSLEAEDLAALARAEIALETEGHPRTRSELDALPRKAPPIMETLAASKPSEQTLQWFFMRRGYLVTPEEPVLARELPTSCAGIAAEGRADLLAFDRLERQPILVELKDGDASDPLTAVVMEILFHWTFHMQHRRDLKALIATYGWIAEKESRLAIVAPESYYQKTQARALRDKRRRGEHERAMDWIRTLEQTGIADLELLSVEDKWLQTDGKFIVRKQLDNEILE